MFHWICPECGREIPPSVRECQACDPHAVSLSVVEPVESTQVAQAVSPVPPLETVSLSVPKSPEPTAEALAPKVDEVVAEPAIAPAPVVEAGPVESMQAKAAPPEPEPPEIEILTITQEFPVKAISQPALETQAIIEVAPGEPVVELQPVIEAVSVLEPEIVPVVAEAAPPEQVVEQPLELVPVPEPVLETPEVAEVATEPVAEETHALEAAPVIEILAEPIAADLPPVEAAAAPAEVGPPEPAAEEPVLEAAPIAPEPVAETQPTVETVPVLVHAPPEPVAEEPVLEAASVAPEPVAETQPTVETVPVLVEAPPEPVAEEPVLEAAPVAPEPVTETQPTVETVPVLAEAAAPEPEPVAETAAVAHEVKHEATPDTQETAIKLHDVPDPLLALAEEIRAAQAARAAALAEPPASNGLFGLVEAVGVQSQAPEAISQPEYAESVSQQVAPPAPIEKNHVTQEAVAAAETATAVALLAPPLTAPEPVSFHELRPVALAPEPQAQPSAEPEPFNPPEPPTEPVALAPEPPPEPEGPTLPFAPMQDYKPATSRSILPVPPRPQILAADAGPRITLPGPTLPPELTRLQDANVLSVIGENTAQRTKEAIPPPKTAGAPGWLVSAFVMLLLLAAGLGVVFYLLPHTVADAKPTPTPAVAATSPVPTGGTSPLAKFIEVTGFRIVTSSPDATKKDAAKKSEVQYLVVNHSDADISDANVFVTLRSAKPGLAPLCRFSFKVPSLGPFESKEMSSPIGNSTRAVSLPDWQEIRAEVQISQ